MHCKLTDLTYNLLRHRTKLAIYKTIPEYVTNLLLQEFAIDPLKPTPLPTDLLEAYTYDIDIQPSALLSYEQLEELFATQDPNPTQDMSFFLNCVGTGYVYPLDEPNLWAKAMEYNRMLKPGQQPIQIPLPIHTVPNMKPVAGGKRVSLSGLTFPLPLTGDAVTLANDLYHYPHLQKPHTINPNYKPPVLEPAKTVFTTHMNDETREWLLQVATDNNLHGKRIDSEKTLMAAALNAIAAQQVIPGSASQACTCICCISRSNECCVIEEE